MATTFEALEDAHIEFINQQKLFFVGTAGDSGLINVSPKGLESFRIFDQSRVVWLNLTGSGNETAAHVLENRQMTVMFCSFEKQPLILRLYGESDVIYPRHEKWDELCGLFPDYLGARQFFELRIQLVQTSCGFGVPYYRYEGERPTLSKWAEKRGADGIKDYWKERNALSMDSKDTGILEDGS